MQKNMHKKDTLHIRESLLYIYFKASDLTIKTRKKYKCQRQQKQLIIAVICKKHYNNNRKYYIIAFNSAKQLIFLCLRHSLLFFMYRCFLLLIYRCRHIIEAVIFPIQIITYLNNPAIRVRFRIFTALSILCFRSSLI